MSINDVLRRYDTIELPRIGAKVLAVASTGVGELFLSYQNWSVFTSLPGVPDTGLDSGFYLPGKDTGQLELHGRKRLRTWTKLAKTANAGDNYFVTSERVDFAPGENLVLPGTEIPNDIFSPEGFGIDQVICCNTEIVSLYVFRTYTIHPWPDFSHVRVWSRNR